MIKTNIKTIKGSYIICKRVRKKPYYYRGDNYSQTTTTAWKALQFQDKAQADAKAKEINDKRKGGHKFRVEASEKHFVNDFKIQYNTWNKELIVSNDLKAIQDVTERRYKVTQTLNDKKPDVVKVLEMQIKAHSEQKEKNKLHFEQQQVAIDQTINNFKQIIEVINGIDLDKTYVEPNLTPGDRTMAVLFGTKTKET